MTVDTERWPDYTEAAVTTITQEIDEVRSECEAFQAFQQRVQELDASMKETQAPVLTEYQTRTSVEERVESLYQETVMDVSHYEEVYDDSVQESVSAEFGNEVKAAISQATGVSPQLQQLLLKAARRSILRRRVFLHTLSNEQTTVKDAWASLRETRTIVEELDCQPLFDSSFDDLIETRETLLCLEDDCRSWLNQRQDQLHDRQLSSNRGDDFEPDLCTYLYQPLEVTYPILATVIETIEIVQTARRRVERAISESS